MSGGTTEKLLQFTRRRKNRFSLAIGQSIIQAFSIPLFIFLFCFLSSISRAQKNIQYNDLRFQHFTTDQGLSSNDVSCFLQDMQGFIWIGTASGLNRFDGYGFKIYQHDPTDSNSISSGDISCMYEDAKGIIWIGTTTGGLNRFDPLSEKFKAWMHNDTIKNSISTNTISAICQGKDQTFWLTSNRGLIHFDYANQSFKLFQHDDKDSTTLSGNGLNSLLADGDQLWIGTFGKGVNIFNTKTGAVTRLKRFSTGTIPDNKDYVHDIVKYNDTLLIASTDRGLISINTLTLNQVIMIDTIEAQHSIKDKNDWLWISSRDGGLILFNPEQKKRINYRADKLNPAALSDNFTSPVFESSDGSFWIGEYLTGFHRVNPAAQNFHILKAPALITGKKTGMDHSNNNYIMSFAEDSDSGLWVGTFNEGIHQFKKTNNGYEFVRNFDKYNSTVTNPFPIVLTKGPGNDIWQGHFGGGEAVVKFDTRTFAVESLQRFKTDGDNAIAENNCTALLWDSSGVLWIGMPRFGLDRYDTYTKTFTHYKYDKNNPNSISGTWVNVIRRDNNILWIGTNGGLSRMNADGTFTNYIHKDNDIFSLAGAEASCMNFDNSGRLWIGTLSGDLNVFDPTANKFLHAKLYSGKRNGSIAGLLIDRSGEIWLSTDAGITSFTPPEHLDSWFNRNKNIDQQEWDSCFHDYDKTDGLPFNQFNEYSYYKAFDGKLFFGTAEGAVVIDPTGLFRNMQPPVVVLTSFTVLNKEVKPGDSTGIITQAINYAKQVTLPPGETVFSIEFSALSFIGSDKNKFAYKLDGFDKEWIETDYKKRSATYTALSPGTYTFHVKASNNDGIWNEAGTSIKIIIEPEWYQTLFFKIATMLITLSSIFFATRYYFRQKLKDQQRQFEKERAIENIRTKISGDIHDEIGAGLTKISLMSQRLKINMENNKNVDPVILQKITESSREITNNLAEIIWAANPKHDNLPSLLAYIRNYIARFFEDTNINYSIDFPEEIPQISVQPDLKRNLFLVVKEALNNIIKHASADKVDIRFRCDEKQFLLEISDNGKGMENLQGRDFGNGLLNMRSRTKAINCKLEISSALNNGTKILLQGILWS